LDSDSPEEVKKLTSGNTGYALDQANERLKKARQRETECGRAQAGTVLGNQYAAARQEREAAESAAARAQSAHDAVMNARR
jgi:hypothetical protein